MTVNGRGVNIYQLSRSNCYCLEHNWFMFTPSFDKNVIIMQIVKTINACSSQCELTLLKLREKSANALFCTMTLQTTHTVLFNHFWCLKNSLIFRVCVFLQFTQKSKYTVIRAHSQILVLGLTGMARSGREAVLGAGFSGQNLRIKHIPCIGTHLWITMPFKSTCVNTINPLNPAGRFSDLCKRGSKNLVGRFSGICYGVSKTQRASKPAHVRANINWFVYTGRYQATRRSQVESSSLFSFRTTCNLLTGFVLDARFCVENMAEILSVCEDTDTRLMLWTM